MHCVMEFFLSRIQTTGVIVRVYASAIPPEAHACKTYWINYKKLQTQLLK